MLLLAAPAFAAPTVLVSAGWRSTEYPMLYEGIPWRHALALEAGVRLPVGLEFGASTRLVFPAATEPSWAVEGGLRAEGVATIGRWRPAAGLELGVSTRSRSEVLETERPPGSYFADLGTPEPLWLDFTATPARFSFGDWELSALGLNVGVSLPHFGLSGRIGADLLTVTRVF